jgi:cytochrome c
MRFAAILAIWLLGANLGPAMHAHSQPMQDRVESGQRFAEIWCSGCHAVELRTTRSGGIAPDFPTIANRRSTTPRSLHTYLRKQHDKMPNFVLEKEDAADVVAFIISLKRKHGP